METEAKAKKTRETKSNIRIINQDDLPLPAFDKAFSTQEDAIKYIRDAFSEGKITEDDKFFVVRVLAPISFTKPVLTPKLTVG